MLAASLIDVDEKTIPDAITVPGTLLGLLLAAAYPWSLLPDAHVLPERDPTVGHFAALDRAEPLAGPAGRLSRAASRSPSPWAALWRWCAALTAADLVRPARLAAGAEAFPGTAGPQPGHLRLLLLAAVGSAAIAAVWTSATIARHWQGLLTALVGMAAGGGLIWLVRIIGSAALGREAMGFGDVTLMAMIGAFLGWQTCLIVFFLAPLAGIVLGIVQLILRRGSEIPYGPFLCLGALGTPSSPGRRSGAGLSGVFLSAGSCP